MSVTGSNFIGATAVNFGVLGAGTWQVNSPTSITATSPPVASGTSVDLTVTTPSGTSATSPSDQFTYNPVPAVTGVSPNTGNTAGATAVTITGTGLTGASASALAPSRRRATRSTRQRRSSVTSPPHLAGTVDVTVAAPGGTSATSSTDQFTYEVAPASPRSTHLRAP